MKNVKLVFVILLVTSQIELAQCPDYNLQLPQLKNVVVKSFVSKVKDAEIFTFRYAITNGTLSTGCINRFQLDITYPLDAIELSRDGLIDYHRYIDRGALLLPNAKKIIPVGISRLPRFGRFSSVWSAGFSIDGLLDWSSAFEKFRLEPGATLDSMILNTYGLPSLRPYIVSPSYNPKPPVIVTPENEDSVYLNTPEPTEEEAEAQLALEDSIKVRGWTIGPTAPPINFIPTIWCDTLLSYTRQSVQLGWLKTTRDDDCDEDEQPHDGVARNIEKRIEKAKKELIKGDSVKARKELEKLVKKVEKIYKKSEEAEKKKRESEIVMTSEAYALLKYNAEYLIERLPEKKKGGKE